MAARKNGARDNPKGSMQPSGPPPGAEKSVPVTERVSACTPEQVAARGRRKPINLALQGGGAHGAFTWGVLDKLLEDDRLALDAISATSAGAMNAVVMAHGVSVGGREGARAKLEAFWREVSRVGMIWSPVRANPFEPLLANTPFAAGLSPSYLLFNALTNFWSPYQLNPLGLNPLKDVLLKVVDFEHLKSCPQATRLFLCATNVRTGKIRVFANREIGADAVLASACLPTMFQAVEIDGEHYWDGGYMGNPAIFPLIYQGASNDVLVVHINPLVRETLPTTATEILDRINEISFNSSLMREMRAIAFVTRLIEDETLSQDRYSRMLVHAIRADGALAGFGLDSKLDPDWHFLTRLRDLGREAAAQWLADHLDDVGRRTSIDIAETYL